MVTKFVRTAAITLPIYSFKKRETGYIKCVSELYKGRELEEFDKEEGKMVKKPAADLMKIIDLETGELMEFIVPKLIMATFEEKLEGMYLGNCYELFVSEKIPEGKRYKLVKVFQIDEPEGVGDGLFPRDFVV